VNAGVSGDSAKAVRAQLPTRKYRERKNFCKINLAAMHLDVYVGTDEGQGHDSPRNVFVCCISHLRSHDRKNTQQYP
jgi:hypothetical protein